MSRENVPEGFGYDGMGTVIYVPTLADPTKPTVAELTGSTATHLTYSLYGATGYSLTATETPRPIDRYTLDQTLNAEGTVAYALTCLYVFNPAEPTPAEEILGVRGTAGYLIHILGYENGFTIAADTVLTDVVPIRTARSITVPATRNTEAHKQTSPSITGEVLHDVKVVAA